MDTPERELRKQSEQALQHMKDQERLIKAAWPDVISVTKPFKERHARNHYMDEAREIYEGRGRR